VAHLRLERQALGRFAGNRRVHGNPAIQLIVSAPSAAGDGFGDRAAGLVLEQMFDAK
jgi:hypothetical protein